MCVVSTLFWLGNGLLSAGRPSVMATLHSKKDERGSEENQEISRLFHNTVYSKHTL